MKLIERNKGIKERIYISKDELELIESQLSLEAHIQRYAFVRQYAHGIVLDCACGCGYGTYMLSKNPDVKLVVGIDRSEKAIEYAESNYFTAKSYFVHCNEIKEFTSKNNIDQLISLETIEHLKNPIDLVDMAVKNNIEQLIISFPTKKSSHYNKFHYHDFSYNDIEELIGRFYNIKDFFEYKREVGFIFAQKNIKKEN